jgi:chromosome segregation ATPase
MKSSSQKEAKKRRKERAKELRDLGRQAASQLASAEMKVESAEVTKALLRKEAEAMRAEHGRVTTELAETRRENEALTVLLDGLRIELSEADAMVKELERGTETLTERVATLERELDAAKRADSDAKPLRTRLATKSREIDDLRSKLNHVVAELAEERRSRPLIFGASAPRPSTGSTGDDPKAG